MSSNLEINTNYLESPVISQNSWELIFNSIKNPIMILDKEQNIIFMNERIKGLVNTNFNDFVGKKCYQVIHGKDHPPENCQYIQTIEKKGEETNLIEFPEVNSCFLFNISPLYDKDQNFYGSIHIAHDITKMKKTEKELLKKLELNELLMREIHHRVKNNLATISSLLYLQSSYTEDPEAKEVLLDSKNRARTMSIIHQKLYTSRNFKKIDLNHYFRQLLDEALKTYSVDDKIHYSLDVDHINFDVDTALILGLILNELLSNSLKHAFFENVNCLIKVKLHKTQENYVLEISDNGKSSENINMENQDSFGLTLINLLTDQLNGQISTKWDQGTVFTLRFPLVK